MSGTLTHPNPPLLLFFVCLTAESTAAATAQDEDELIPQPPPPRRGFRQLSQARSFSWPFFPPQSPPRPPK
ncbi:hypothetical protein BHE74_00012318 [Ensete ventricosum]|nr:hypothetical protein BHE74_00012318 [Ensete ventricosum]